MTKATIRKAKKYVKAKEATPFDKPIKRGAKPTEAPKTMHGVYHPEGYHMAASETWKGWKKTICIAVPATGLVRIEWMMARFGQIVPCNWRNGDIFKFYNQCSPLGWAVADARNYFFFKQKTAYEI